MKKQKKYAYMQGNNCIVISAYSKKQAQEKLIDKGYKPKAQEIYLY